MSLTSSPSHMGNGNIFQNDTNYKNIYQYLPIFLYSIFMFHNSYGISHYFTYLIVLCQYFTVFHSISQYYTVLHSISQYTHQDRLVVRLPTQSLRLSLVQADPDLPAARPRSRNPNLFWNLRFLVGWQLHQPTGPGRRPTGRWRRPPCRCCQTKLDNHIPRPRPT